MKKLILLIGFCVMLCVISACTSDDGTCHSDRTVLAGVSFYTMNFNATTETFSRSATTQRIVVQGVGSDSVLYNANASKIYLPLRATSNSTSFVLVRDTLGADTLTFYHTNNQQFMSFACGCFTFHHIDSVRTTHHQIDSVVVAIPQVENVLNEHVRLYFR